MLIRFHKRNLQNKIITVRPTAMKCANPVVAMTNMRLSTLAVPGCYSGIVLTVLEAWPLEPLRERDGERVGDIEVLSSKECSLGGGEEEREKKKEEIKQ